MKIQFVDLMMWIFVGANYIRPCTKRINVGAYCIRPCTKRINVGANYIRPNGY